MRVHSVTSSTGNMSAAAAFRNIEEHKVFVKWRKDDGASTIVQLVSWMIDDASEIHERLYKVEVGGIVNIIFKFTNDEDSSKDASEREDMISERCKHEQNWNNVAMESKDTISVLCKHEHPYLDKAVWLETKGRMDSTFLTGTIVVRSIVYCRVAEKGISESKTISASIITVV